METVMCDFCDNPATHDICWHNALVSFTEDVCFPCLLEIMAEINEQDYFTVGTIGVMQVN